MNKPILPKKNLDRLADFLIYELGKPDLAEQIPDGSYVFYGSCSDPALTQANLKFASKILLSMFLGYVEAAPLVMCMNTSLARRSLLICSRNNANRM
ncbi:hypothetical protein L0337_17620 [candidate division KSB1 bacterium]|nr:hypothetical protein [candidate division KSB1 bacterium]